MKKIVLFSLFASLMVYASVKSTQKAVHPTNATVNCCSPPPECTPDQKCPEPPSEK